MHKCGDTVWVLTHTAWRKGTVEKVGKVNHNRVQVRVVVNNRTGREVVKWFGGAGQPPTYPGSFTDPPAYTCTEKRCGMYNTPMHGHPGNTVAEIKAAHERAWHKTMLRVVREEDA